MLSKLLKRNKLSYDNINKEADTKVKLNLFIDVFGRDYSEPDRLFVEGFLSYIKGCSILSLSQRRGDRAKFVKVIISNYTYKKIFLGRVFYIKRLKNHQFTQNYLVFFLGLLINITWILKNQLMMRSVNVAQDQET